MNKLGILALVALLMVSCDNTEKKAQEKLTAAQTAFEKGDFNGAKLLLDSIKILYPKAFEVRKEGIKLLQQVELKEQQAGLVYLDSMLQVKQKAFEEIKDKFVLEKDTAYQKVGNYLYPTQTVEKNLHRSYLRAQVNERGEMSMTSIYCGSHNIHHSAVKVIAKDGTFAETPASNDSYETTDLGEKIEKCDYKLGNDGNVIGFIFLNKDNDITVNYLGERKYSVKMQPNDRKAFAAAYELSQALSAIEAIKKEQKEANLKIDFVTRKIAEGKVEK